MDVCVDLGNSDLVMKVYHLCESKASCRYQLDQYREPLSSLAAVVRELFEQQQLDLMAVQRVMVCSVVPQMNDDLTTMLAQLFQRAEFKTSWACDIHLTIDVDHPEEVGMDRLLAASGAMSYYPNQPIIVVDLGTATTYAAISSDQVFYAGPIMVGMKTSMEALQQKTALLSSVEIVVHPQVVGRNTTDNIQSGLYVGHLATIRAITQQISDDFFPGESVFVIGTGGFSALFKSSGVFDALCPDLIFQGMLSLSHRLAV